jgi:transposase
MPLAGLPGPVRPSDDDLQSLPALDDAGGLATAVPGPGGGRSRRGANDRLHHSQGPPLGGGRKRGDEVQAIGRSRGGRTTKIHAVVDGSGRPIAFEITPGQLGDVRAALALLGPLPPAALCAADTAYDSNGLRQFLIARGTLPVIPNNPTRKQPHPFHRPLYRERNLIERMFCRLKDWRRVATRYDKLAAVFAATVYLAAIVTWWT